MVSAARAQIEAALGELALFEVAGDAEEKPRLRLVWGKAGSNFAARVAAGEGRRARSIGLRCEACA